MPIEQKMIVRILLAERVKVIAFILSLVRRHDFAEDVFQDVCVLALEKHAEIENEQHLLRWVRVAARLYAMNLLRRERKGPIPLSEDVMQLLEKHWQQQDSTDSSAVLEALRACLQVLTAGARKILQQRYGEGLSMEVIAAELNRPVNSVYVTLSRAHNALAECVFRRIALDKGESHA